MELFLIKKWIGALLSPLPLLTILLTLLLIRVWSNHQHRPLRRLVTMSWLWLMLFSTSFLPDLWLGQFEKQYPAYHFQQPKVDEVLVLGCTHNEAQQQPITSQVAACSMARLNEGLRILQHYPAARLVLSGGSLDKNRRSNAEVVAELAIALGTPASRIITEPNAKDTAEEAELLASRLAGRKLVLVTSASHMPRAMHLFAARGLNPIAAPTHFIATTPHSAITGLELLPHPNHLEKSRRAFYETMGLAWAILTAWLDR